MQFFNAYCIINHRLHTGWQSWRGTKSTVASQPRSIPDRCWWLLNQLWLPRGSCRCVCVLCVYSVWYIYVGVLNVCSSVFVMRLQDTPSVPTLFGKSPLCPSSRKCSPPASGCHIHSQTWSDLYLSSLGWGHLAQNAHMGAALFIMFLIVVMHDPRDKKLETQLESDERRTGLVYQSVKDFIQRAQ